MDVYDPYAGTLVKLEECEQARALGEFVPVKSPRSDQWFMVHFPTMISRKVETFDGNNLKEIRQLIGEHAVGDLLLDACCRTQEGPTDGPPVWENRDALLRKYGSAAIETAEARAIREGFRLREVRRAYSVLLENPSIDEVETIRLSELLTEA